MSKPLYLVPIDGSENSARALDFACDIAKATGASLLIAHIINWSGYKPVSPLEIAERPIDKQAEEDYTRNEILAPAVKAVKAKGIKADTWFNWGHPAKQLFAEAKKEGVNMIIMGRSGHGSIAELVLGSVSNSLVHHADIPVVLVP